MRSIGIITAVMVMFLALPAWASTQQAKPATAPSTIAGEYPGDVGIGKDPAVILHEDFEAGKIDKTKWTNITNKPGVLKLTGRTLDVHRGRRSLEVWATMGKDTGGHLFTRFGKGYEQMYARYCVKFADDIDYIHHFVRMVAYEPPRPAPSGRAGIKPAGNDRFTVAVEPWGRWGRYPKPGGWHYYCYWWKMPRSKDGKFWGQDFADKPYAIPKPGKWYCVEFMAKCNTPGKDNGETAFWIDGKKLAHHKNINWRASDRLKLNGFWLMLYVTDRSATDAKPGKVNRVWFDDIVVATRYIGPPVKPKPVREALDRRSKPAGPPTYRLKQRVRGILDQYHRKPVSAD